LRKIDALSESFLFLERYLLFPGVVWTPPLLVPSSSVLRTKALFPKECSDLSPSFLDPPVLPSCFKVPDPPLNQFSPQSCRLFASVPPRREDLPFFSRNFEVFFFLAIFSFFLTLGHTPEHGVPFLGTMGFPLFGEVLLLVFFLSLRRPIPQFP